MKRDALVDHAMELLAPLGAVRARRMFGGHGVYVDGLFIALIAFDHLYLKADSSSAPQFEAAGCKPFEFTAKGKTARLNYWTAPPEAMDSPEQMRPWARLAMQAALTARAAKRPKAAPPPQPPLPRRPAARR